MDIVKHKPFAYRLLVRPSPVKEESLRGYLMRVGERNGYGKGVNLYRRLTGNCSSRYLISEQAIDQVAESMQLGRDRIEMMSYRRISGSFDKFLFFGQLVFMNELRSQHPAVCPECLREQQTISGLWDLKAVCACPHHGKWLHDLCPACGKELTWRRPLIIRCLCGFDLRTIEAKPAPSDVLALTALIYERVLHDVPTCDEHPRVLPEVVTKIPLGRLLALFGLASTVAWRNPIATQVHGYSTVGFAYKVGAALLLAQLLKPRPSDQLMLLAGYAPSMDKAAQALASLNSSRFNNHCWPLWPLSHLVPSLFKQVVQQFLDEHCIFIKGRGRYLNPSVVWRDANGQRVLKLKTCLDAIGLPIKGVHEDEVISFATYLQMKVGIFGAPDPNRCSTPSNVAMAEIPP